MADNNTEADSRVSNSKLNWLRAAVLGANDGIVSVASIALGVAAATSVRGPIFTAGLAGLVAGALSMAAGEYVSVSSQRDTEKAYIDKEKARLRNHGPEELKQLTEIYQAKGLGAATAKQVAIELTAHDPIKAHLDAELKIDEEDLTNPTQAAFASMISFTAGGIIPLLTIVLVTARYRIAVTFIAVLIALCVTGYGSATVGGAPRLPATVRVVIGGALAMIITYGIGLLFGTAV